jgi:hypothetical protein
MTNSGGICCLIGQTNSNGMCCPPGQTNCGGHCIDLRFTPSHCGACGNVCGAGQYCSSGK